MERKVLFVGFKRDDGILIGGGMGIARSIRMLHRIFGEQHVDRIYVHENRHPRSIWNKLYAPFGFLLSLHNGLTPHKLNTIVRRAEGYDYVFLSTSVLGVIAKRLREHGYHGKIIVQFHNIESIYYDAQMPKWLPGRSIVLRSAAHNDRYACQYAHRIMTVSQRDADYLEAHYGRKTDAVVTVALADRFRPVDTSRLTSHRPRCLFMGAYSKPNNMGVLFFVNEVLPHVDIDFRIVGKGMQHLKDEHPDELASVEVVGDVPDLRPYIEAADFMILPLFTGSGMKIKTAESLMYGKNIIGSDETFVGYDLDVSMVGACCNTADEYIAALKGFARQPMTVFNPYSRQVFVDHYSEDSPQSAFCSVFDEEPA